MKEKFNPQNITERVKENFGSLTHSDSVDWESVDVDVDNISTQVWMGIEYVKLPSESVPQISIGSAQHSVSEVADVHDVREIDVAVSAIEDGVLYDEQGREIESKFYKVQCVLQHLYENQGKSKLDIADSFNCSVHTVRRWMETFDIQEEDARWADGVSWTKRAVEIRERDNNRCISCGMTKTENIEKHGGDLHVHHVIPQRFFESDVMAHSKENLVTLCSECHQKYEDLTPRRLLQMVCTD